MTTGRINQVSPTLRSERTKRAAAAAEAREAAARPPPTIGKRERKESEGPIKTERREGAREFGRRSYTRAPAAPPRPGGGSDTGRRAKKRSRYKKRFAIRLPHTGAAADGLRCGSIRSGGRFRCGRRGKRREGEEGQRLGRQTRGAAAIGAGPLQLLDSPGALRVGGRRRRRFLHPILSKRLRRSASGLRSTSECHDGGRHENDDARQGGVMPGREKEKAAETLRGSETRS